MAIPTSPERIRASLSAEIDAARELPPFTREALLVAFVPFAELFCREQALGTPEAGRRVADATAAVAAAIIGHLLMNASRPNVDKDVAIRQFLKLVEQRVFASLAADAVTPSNEGRWH